MIKIRAGSTNQYRLSNLLPDGVTHGEIHDNYLNAQSSDPTVATVTIDQATRVITVVSQGQAGLFEVIVTGRADLGLTVHKLPEGVAPYQPYPPEKALHDQPVGVQEFERRFAFESVPTGATVLELIPVS